jgi:CheY-like chemotaxis protein
MFKSHTIIATSQPDGQDALVQLAQVFQSGSEVAMMVCDLNMPHMSGKELLKVIRNHPKYRAIPFVVITSQSEASNVLEILDLGATDYLVKPFDSKQFLEKLQTVWSRHLKKRSRSGSSL